MGRVRIVGMGLLLWGLVACAAPAATPETGGSETTTRPTETVVSPTETAALPTETVEPSPTTPPGTVAPTPGEPPTMTPFVPLPTPTATHTPEPGSWTSYRIETDSGTLVLDYPAEWQTNEGGIDFASINFLGPLKLVAFSEFPDASMGTMYSAEETLRRFRESFAEGATITERTVNEIPVTIIEYTMRSEVLVYTQIEVPGTLALWQAGGRNFALFDEGSQQQENGVFERILASVRSEAAIQ